jgi:hypothetical protein
MQHVYIVISSQGFIFGVYAKYENALTVFQQLMHDNDGLRLSTEPVISKAAHFPNK